MAEVHARQSCASDTPRCAAMNLSVNLIFTDVWTNPGLRAVDPDLKLAYNDASFTTPIPTDNACVTAWTANCRIIINYVKHIQALWDKPRPVIDPMTMLEVANHTCSRAGCHNTVDANNAAMVPAGQLDLQNVASDEQALQLRSYRELFFSDNAQDVVGGALVDRLVPGPPDQNGNPTQVTVGVGPYLNGGSARGTLSAAFLNRFAPGSGSDHSGWLSPSELRLLSEWLDIGAQYFNNPFDPAVPLN